MMPASQFLLFGVMQFPVILLGFPLVAIGLPFTRIVKNDSGRDIIRLPVWLLPWDNAVDGLLGDGRGFYADYTKGWNPYFAMWWWAAVRNPANYFKRFILAIDITRYRTRLLAGQAYVRDDFNSTGWQLLEARRSGFTAYHFYLVKRWFNTNHAIVIQLGFKFRVGQEFEAYGTEQYRRFKGFTFEVAPFKDIS
jgi:hypothetical protein